nr:LCP family protein [Lachnospiraceae bacterium]
AYHYNEDLLTFLVMGIYTEDLDREILGVYTFDPDKKLLEGEADANFLCVFNPKADTVSVISLNRNSMVGIDYYNEDGIYLVREQAQLALQHGFGRDKEHGSILQMEAVQRLMMGIPVHGHVAVDMRAVEQMNHAVGGVEVTVLEDLTKADSEFVQGRKLRLTDDQAFWYVKYRDWQSYASADRRLQRDMQFLQGFIQAAKEQMHEDWLFPYRLYQECDEHIYTNLSTDKIMMLLMMVKDYDVENIQFYSLPGETRMGEKYEEFYVDQAELTEMILELFYEEEDSR